MNWIDKMERKFRGRGIPNLTVYVIICYVVGYLLSYIQDSSGADLETCDLGHLSAEYR